MAHPPGWYNDASTPGVVRWWDGEKWTEHTRPIAPAAATSPPLGLAGTALPDPVTGVQAGAPVKPTTASPFGPGGAGDVSTTPLWKRPWVAAVAIVVIALGLAGLVFGLTGDSSDDAVELTPAATDTDDADNSDADNSGTDDADNSVAGTDAVDEAGPTESAEVVDERPEPDVIVPATDAEPDDDVAQVAADGTRLQPYRFDAAVPIVWETFGDADGSVWNIEVATPRDIADAIAAENQFNDPPPDGVAYLGFDVSMALVEAGKQPLSGGFNFSWEVFGGATSGVYDTSTIDTQSYGCGVVPGALDVFAEVFVGGSVDGTVCIPVPAEDVGHPDTLISLTFTMGDRVLFGGPDLTGPDPLPLPVPDVVAPAGSTAGDGTLRRPYATGAPVDVTVEGLGDAEESVWTTQVGTLRDITAEVLAENQFNDPPADGMVFVGFDVSMTLVSSDVEPLAPSIGLSWEVLGGATGTVHQRFGGGFGCGVVPGELDGFAEVLVGGTLSGTVCIPVAAADLEAPGTGIALSLLAGERLVFQDTVN